MCSFNRLSIYSLALLFTLTACGGGGGGGGGDTQTNVAPTASAVSITDGNGGDPLVGDLLTGEYTYADADNDAEGTSTFRWLRDGVAIAGATASTYTLTTTDSGTQISFEVTPVAATGAASGAAVGTSVASSGLTVINSAPFATGVSILDANGGAVIGSDLLIGQYTYADAENDAEGATTFRWLSDGVLISTDPSVALNNSPGTQITFEVTPVAATGTATGVAVVSPGVLVLNAAPTAINVSITDDNGGDALANDSLTGYYFYLDLENDAEGTTLFQWYRDGNPIPGATASSYTLAPADDPSRITFAVTPVANSGTTPGIAAVSAELPVGATPVVAGVARYRDMNRNGMNDSQDELIVPFNVPVTINNVGAADFDLPVAGDTLGSTPGIRLGPAPNELTIILSSLQNLKTRGNTGGNINVNSPSGIDVSNTLAGTGGAIQSIAGISAIASSAIDIVPDFIDSNQSLGNATNDASNNLALADIDGDGDIDMAVSSGSELLAIFSNTGAGGFVPFGNFATGDARDVALGDIDGDGDLDMVTANNGPNRVWVNNGFFNFLDSGQLLGNLSSTSVELGDVDGDGDLDMVVGNSGTQGYQVWLNSGLNSGIFTSLNQPKIKAWYIALGDVDDDGDLDIVAANSGTGNKVLLNSNVTPGVFSDSGQSLGSNQSQSVALGDVDADGDLDLVVANVGGNRVWLNSNSTPGVFTDSGQSLGNNVSYSAALGDVDGDGDLDMVVANSGQGNKIWLNNRFGVFTDPGISLGSNNSRDAALADVDGDGDLDIVVANFNQGNRVYMNSLAGTWGNSTLYDSGQTWVSGATRSVALGDIDNDGRLDMVAANYGELNTLARNTGSQFLAEETWGDTSNSWSVALGDLNGDGYLDIALANANQGNQVWLNNRAGVFVDSGQSLGANDSRAITLGDVDGDGDLDMVVANYQQKNTVWRNNGNGVFAAIAQPNLFINDNSNDVALGDIDLDGDLDMVVANAGESHVWLNSNATPGVFTSAAPLSLGSSSRSVALGDIDGNGTLDIVSANFFGEGNRVFKNSSSITPGTFTDTLQSLGSDFSLSVELADIDGDGDLDIIEGNATMNVIWVNDGSGGFTDSGKVDSSTGMNASYSVSVGDIDNDGDLDIAVGNNLQPNQIYLNQ